GTNAATAAAASTPPFTFSEPKHQLPIQTTTTTTTTTPSLTNHYTSEFTQSSLSMPPPLLNTPSINTTSSNSPSFHHTTSINSTVTSVNVNASIATTTTPI